MARTVFSPRCWATSSTSVLPLLSVVSAFRISWQVVIELNVDDGADDLGDFAGCVCHVVSPVCLERFRARNNFDQLVRDHGLTRAVVLMVSLSIMSPALRVALSIADIRAPFLGCAIFQQSCKDGVATARQKVGQDGLFVRLVVIERACLIGLVFFEGSQTG